MTAAAVRPFRVLIVDDEPAARRGVAQLIEHDPALEVIGECSTGDEMLHAIDRDGPDLIFLDVQMPGLDGFEALARVHPRNAPLVIFVTGYDRYAVRAFEAHAIDYLLKPYAPERFERSCTHAKEQMRQRRLAHGDGYQQRLLGLLESLAARTSAPAVVDRREPVRFLARTSRTRSTIVSADTVLWVEADRDYVRLHTKDGRFLIRETMASVERRLDSARFARVHRSVIVRLDAIAEIRAIGATRIELTLADGTRLRVSASGRRLLHESLGLRA